MQTEQGLEDRHGLETGLKRRHVTMLALGGVIGSMAFVDETRDQLRWSLGSVAVVLLAYLLRARLGSERRPERPPGGALVAGR